MKKIVNQSRFERIMAMILWPHFVWPTPYTRRIGRLYIGLDQVVDPVLSVAALTPATPRSCDMINVLCSCMSMVMLQPAPRGAPHGIRTSHKNWSQPN